MGLLEGRVALITGGGRGMGRAHAVTFAREGADVVLLDITEQVETAGYATGRPGDLEQTAELVRAQGRRALTVVGDVRSQEALDGAVASAVAEFGKVDILVANAGIWSLGSFWELSEQTWSELIDINLGGVWRAVKAVTPHMIERGSGSIVAVASINAHEAAPNFAHYAAAKHGLIGLVSSMALELGPHGVRCNVISPTATLTPMVSHQDSWNAFSGNDSGTEADLIKGGYAYSALRGQSFLAPETVAETALFLASDKASAITGVAVPVDGGHLLLPGYNAAAIPSE
jgi:SDR family mycofactocin-dependent oxidoreductase